MFPFPSLSHNVTETDSFVCLRCNFFSGSCNYSRVGVSTANVGSRLHKRVENVEQLLIKFPDRRRLWSGALLSIHAAALLPITRHSWIQETRNYWLSIYPCYENGSGDHWVIIETSDQFENETEIYFIKIINFYQR